MKPRSIFNCGWLGAALVSAMLLVPAVSFAGSLTPSSSASCDSISFTNDVLSTVAYVFNAETGATVAANWYGGNAGQTGYVCGPDDSVATPQFTGDLYGLSNDGLLLPPGSYVIGEWNGNAPGATSCLYGTDFTDLSGFESCTGFIDTLPFTITAASFTEATSTLDQVQQDWLGAMMLYFASMVFAIWLLRKR